MAQISGRRADQLGDFVAVLKFSAVDLDHRAGIADQALRHGFHQACFARTGGTKEQEIADRPAGAVHPGDVRLVSAHDGIDGLVLADDALMQSARQLSGFRAYLRGVECLSEPFHNASALVPATTLDSGDERCVSCAPEPPRHAPDRRYLQYAEARAAGGLQGKKNESPIKIRKPSGAAMRLDLVRRSLASVGCSQNAKEFTCLQELRSRRYYLGSNRSQGSVRSTSRQAFLQRFDLLDVYTAILIVLLDKVAELIDKPVHRSGKLLLLVRRHPALGIRCRRCS